MCVFVYACIFMYGYVSFTLQSCWLFFFLSYFLAFYSKNCLLSLSFDKRNNKKELNVNVIVN